MQDRPVSIQRPAKPPLVNLVTTGDKQSLPRPDEENCLKENLHQTKENTILTTTDKKESLSLSFLKIHK
jgi:hypothetical protein